MFARTTAKLKPPLPLLGLLIELASQSLATINGGENLGDSKLFSPPYDRREAPRVNAIGVQKEGWGWFRYFCSRPLSQFSLALFTSPFSLSQVEGADEL